MSTRVENVKQDKIYQEECNSVDNSLFDLRSSLNSGSLINLNKSLLSSLIIIILGILLLSNLILIG